MKALAITPTAPAELLRRRLALVLDDALIYAGGGEYHLNGLTMDDLVERLAKAAEEGPREINPGGARLYVRAKRLLEQGTPPEQVAAVLGVSETIVRRMKENLDAIAKLGDSSAP